MVLSHESHQSGPPSWPVLLFYATRDGQSRRIAVRIGRELAQHGIVASPRDLTTEPAAPQDLARASVAVLVAAVRYGRHLPEAGGFLRAWSALPSRPALALASVNLTARKLDKSTAESNPYLRKLIARTRCTPAVTAVFAGRLDYRHYRWLDRQAVRAIMWLTGGPTDPAACVEYTAWDAVDAFARRIAQVHAGRIAARPGK